jgi:hypothetical protein
VQQRRPPELSDSRPAAAQPQARRPVRQTNRLRVHRAQHGDLVSLIRHHLSGYGVRFGLPAPARDGPAVIIAFRFFARIGQQRIAFADILEVAQNRLGRRGIAARAEMPL